MKYSKSNSVISPAFLSVIGIKRAVRGFFKRKDTSGWIGVDRDPSSAADIFCDIEKGLPFPDRSVDFIYTSHTLEHVSNLIALMGEFWRVLKKDGLIEIIVPHFNTADAYRHPDHKRFMHQDLWDYWNPAYDQNDRDSYGVKAWFEVVMAEGGTKALNFVHENGLFTTLRKID